MPGPYTTKQVGDMLGVSDSRVRQLAIALKMSTKFGGVWMFSDEDVSRLREAQAPKGRPAKPTPPTTDR
jgi:hypothetical protein